MTFATMPMIPIDRRSASSRKASARHWLTVASLVFFPGLVHPQKQITIDTVPSCPGCRIELKKVAEFGGDDPEVPFVWFVVRASDGTLFGTPTTFSGVRAIRPNGNRVAIGRQGRGPGEFLRYAGWIGLYGDSLIVHEPEQGRMTVFTPAFQLARTFSTHRNASNITVLRSGRIALLSDDNRQVTVFDREGKVIQTIPVEVSAAQPPPQEDGAGAWGRQHGIEAAGDSIWITHPMDYRFELWSATGQPIETIFRPASWFSHEGVPVGENEKPPHSRVGGLYIDSSGLLWVATAIAASDWHKGPQPKTSSEVAAYWDTMIDIIDLRTHRLVTSTRLHGAFGGLHQGLLMYHPHENAEGIDVFDVFQLTLRRK